jgi:hypothetical protein
MGVLKEILREGDNVNFPKEGDKLKMVSSHFYSGCKKRSGIRRSVPQKLQRCLTHKFVTSSVSSSSLAL